MVRNYVIRKVFDSEQIGEIKFMLESESENMWVDGLQSGSEDYIKKNLEFSSNCFTYHKIKQITMSALDGDDVFNNFTLAKSSSPIIISKYSKGDHYKIHQDNITNGNFSTTIFLDDPDTYDGGELCLYINGKEEKFKLTAGWAITYETGIFHRVSPVKHGERKAVVFWSYSDVKDMFLLHIYNEIVETRKTFIESMIENELEFNTDYEDFESVKSNPLIRLSSIGNEILRKII